MKNVKKMLLPAFVLLAGIGGAFATHTAKNADVAVQNGFRYDPMATAIKCIETDVQCSDTGSTVCTWTDAENVSHDLYREVNETVCGDELFEYNP